MLGEPNEISSEGEASKWALRQLAEKYKLTATDAASNIEDSFRAKLASLQSMRPRNCSHKEPIYELVIKKIKEQETKISFSSR